MVVKKADKSKEAETVVDEKEKIENTVAWKIWAKIKDVPIEIFALPNQTVQNHVEFQKELAAASLDSAFVILRSAAVKPALEEALGRVRLGKNHLGQPLVFEISDVTRYTVIKIVPRTN